MRPGRILNLRFLKTEEPNAYFNHIVHFNNIWALSAIKV